MSRPYNSFTPTPLRGTDRLGSGLTLRSINESLQLFRQASRELFNHYFRPDDVGSDEAWLWRGRFELVEDALFQQLVVEPHGLKNGKYGAIQWPITVSLRHGDFAPIMINREEDSGYWDFPLKEFSRESGLQFVKFFDWDLFGVRNNQYVRVVITAWPSHPEAIGKHALVDVQYVQYSET